METVYFRKDLKEDADKEAKKLREQGMRVTIRKDAKLKDYQVIVSPPIMKGWAGRKKVEEPTEKELLDEE